MTGEPDLGALADAGEGEPPRDLRRGAEEQLAGHRNAATDHNHVGVEGVERVGDPDPEALSQRAQRLDRLGVAGLCRLDRVATVDSPASAASFPSTEDGLRSAI